MYGDTTEEHNKLGKILIDLPPEYSKQFGLNPTKSEIKLPIEFLERVKAIADEEKHGVTSNEEKTPSPKHLIIDIGMKEEEKETATSGGQPAQPTPRPNPPSGQPQPSQPARLHQHGLDDSNPHQTR